MALGSLRREEQIGLAVAVALHAALIGALLLRPSVKTPPIPQPISVTLSDDTGLTATAPSHADAAAAVAPTLGAPKPETAPAPAISPPPPQVAPAPVERPLPAPKPVALTRPTPEMVARPVPVPRPKPKPVIKPMPLPKPVQVAEPQPQTPPRHPVKPARKQRVEDTIGETIAAAKPAPRHAPSVKDWALAAPASADRQPAGASRIGNDFLKGVAAGKPSGKAATQGAAVIGPEERSALSGAIAHQLKPHWVAPEGVDADQLVTVLAWDLNRDGTLAGAPRVLSQSGITDSNRPQAARHAEQAIRAVRLAAPFDLPAQYYDVWKHVRSFEFNRKLSQ